MLLNLTPEQQAILLEIHTKECQKQLAIHFNDPDKDAQRLREFVNLQGGAEMLVYLLDFDRAVLEQQEERKQELLGRPTGD